MEVRCQLKELMDQETGTRMVWMVGLGPIRGLQSPRPRVWMFCRVITAQIDCIIPLGDKDSYLMQM